MSADGSNERRLTSLPGHEFYPDWSPDGKQIVYLSSQNGTSTLALLTRTAEGWGTPHDLLGDKTSGYPRWSPDGRLIAYAAGTRGVRVVAAQGGALRVLVPDVTTGLAVWSRDSRTVYYKVADDDQRSSIWSVPAGGRDAKVAGEIRRSGTAIAAPGVGRE